MLQNGRSTVNPGVLFQELESYKPLPGLKLAASERLHHECVYLQRLLCRTLMSTLTALLPGLQGFGWERHDGHTFGRQELYDGNIHLTTSFAKRFCTDCRGQPPYTYTKAALTVDNESFWRNIASQPCIKPAGPELDSELVRMTNWYLIKLYHCTFHLYWEVLTGDNLERPIIDSEIQTMH